MQLIAVSLVLLLAGGFIALLLAARSRLANTLGATSAVCGCIAGLIPAVQVLWTGEPFPAFSRAWDVPYGSFTIELDALSAWFVVPILGLSALGAVYGWQYLLHDADRKPLGKTWFHYNVLVAAMLVVVVARNGVLFLVAWEIMALSSFFLVVYKDEDERVRAAGRTYLIASHLGTAFLLAFFVLLGRDAGSLEFSQISAWVRHGVGFSTGTAGALFVLAIIGFGTKAGFMPMHVWLPEAHPVAPSHVSAVMSGVMIKTGIYGILRALTFLGAPPEWWGWVLIGIGVTSGVLGVLNALAQHDLKRLLAYHSVENIGIIALGMGTGLLGIALHEPAAVALGFAGALLHVVNHAVFKGLLFLGAGAVIHSTGSGEIERLGGLARRMPVTAVTFLIGAIAISGLPPLNGFVSEFLIYVSAFDEQLLGGANGGVPALLVIGSLALIGGLAAACFSKAFGIVFLGVPRTEQAEQAGPAGWLMRIPMVALAAACVLIAVFAVPILNSLHGAVATVAQQPPERLPAAGSDAAAAVSPVVAGVLLFFGATAVLVIVRLALLRNREVGRSPTWDCGYAAPSKRMQYTASSFAEPLTAFFAPLFGNRRKVQRAEGLFPADASFESHPYDVFFRRLFGPAFRGAGWLMRQLSWLQGGSVNWYVLYIAATILVLLIWFLGGAA
jgi:hydrogenase-4 component B